MRRYHGVRTYSGQYFRKGSDFYLVQHDPSRWNPRWQITLVRQNKLIHWQVPDFATEYTSRPNIETLNSFRTGEDLTLWDRLLIRHFGPNEPWSMATFKQLIASPCLVICSRPVGENGIPLHYVKISHKLGILEFWFDEAMNNWIRRATYESHVYRGHRHEWEITSFARAHDGAVVPTVIDHCIIQNGCKIGQARTILSDVKLNGPFLFDSVKGPSLEGVMCDDFERNVRYRLNAIGDPISPEIIIPKPLPPKELLYPFDLNGEKNRNIGTQDTLSAGDVAAFAVVVAASVVGICWLIRNRLQK